ncbi:unnamed protein product [Choristocarpus tenellus]
MYSLSVKERRDADENRGGSREQLWANLNDKNKKDRMLRRIYERTSNELANSCKARREEWVASVAIDSTHWTKDEPELSVHQHTFRDRQAAEELGPANGHFSGRKYIPRWVVYVGGGDLHKERTNELMRTLAIPSRMRGNDPGALHNPCTHTVMVSDTVRESVCS